MSAAVTSNGARSCRPYRARAFGSRFVDAASLFRHSALCALLGWLVSSIGLLVQIWVILTRAWPLGSRPKLGRFNPGPVGAGITSVSGRTFFVVSPFSGRTCGLFDFLVIGLARRLLFFNINSGQRSPTGNGVPNNTVTQQQGNNAAIVWRSALMIAKQPAMVFVVDGCPSDYRRLVHETDTLMAHVEFFRTGQEALQSAKTRNAALWIINLQLPDMSGIDLQTMLRARGCKSPVILSGDEYRVNDEMTARSQGAAMYCPKPVPAEMVAACC